MKTSAVIRLIVWIVVAIVLVSLLIVGLTGGLSRIPGFRLFGSNGWNFPGGSYFAGGDDSNFTVASNVSVPDKSVRAIEIDWVAGAADIVSYNGDTIMFEESGRIPDDPDYQMRYSVENETLKIRFARSGITTGGLSFRSLDKKLTIRIPRSIDLKLLSVNSASAEITIDGVDAGDISADSASGDIKITNSFADRYNIDTASGEIVTSEIEADRVSLNTASGNVEVLRSTVRELNINTASGRIEVSGGSFSRAFCDTASGSIMAETNTMPEDISFDTVSGSMTLKIPENDGFRASYSKVSGSIKCEFDAVLSRDSVIYKNGGPTFRFNTVSGSVNIKKR